MVDNGRRVSALSWSLSPHRGFIVWQVERLRCDWSAGGSHVYRRLALPKEAVSSTSLHGLADSQARDSYSPARRPRISPLVRLASLYLLLHLLSPIVASSLIMAPPHPLKGLSVDEINRARQVIIDAHPNEVIDFREIFLQEPPKSQLIKFLEAGTFNDSREADQANVNVLQNTITRSV